MNKMKKILACALALCMALALVACSGGNNTAEGGETTNNTAEGGETAELPDAIEGRGTLVWNDEFDGDTLDESKWGYQIGTHDV